MLKQYEKFTPVDKREPREWEDDDHYEQLVKKLESIGRQHVKYPWRCDDGSIIYFAQGNKDAWCVYYCSPQGWCPDPFQDTTIFRMFRNLGSAYGNLEVYGHFFDLFTHAKKEPYYEILNRISCWTTFGYDIKEIQATPNGMKMSIEALFVFIYYAMVSEEVMYSDGLGSRVKNLAMYQLLINNEEPSKVANWSRGRPRSEIAVHCDSAEEDWWDYIINNK